MPKFKQVLKSCVATVIHDKNYATLDICLESLANNSIRLCRADDLSKPLSEAEIRGINLDLGTMHFNKDTLEQCLDKFTKHGLVQCDNSSSIPDSKQELVCENPAPPPYPGELS